MGTCTVRRGLIICPRLLHGNTGGCMTTADTFNELADLNIWLPHGKKKSPQYINDLGIFVGEGWDKPEHWMTLDHARALVKDHPQLLAGVGLVIDKSTVVAGQRLNAIDVDLIDGYCKVDPVNGITAVTFDPVADADKVRRLVPLIDQINTYWEAGPSRTGVHALFWTKESWAAQYANTGRFYPGGCDHAEYYTGEAPTYITVTFNPLGVCTPLGVLDEAAQTELAPQLKPVVRGKDAPVLVVSGDGTAFDLLHLICFNTKHRQMLNGDIPIGQRSEVVRSLLIALIDAPACYSMEDIRASVLANAALLAYFSKHADPVEFADQEIAGAYGKSTRGKREALIGFNEGWGTPVALKPAPSAPTATSAPTVSLLIERPLTDVVLTTPIPPWPSVIGSFLPIGVVTETDGAHGIGKSALGLHAALSTVCGVDYYGFSVNQPGKAVFASKEDPYDVIVLRIQAWLKGFAPSERPALQDKIQRNLTIYGCDETEALMLTSSDGRTCSIREDAVDVIVERWQGAVLVVLETASLLHGGDELNEDLLVLVAALKRIASRLKSAVNLIRHISKSATREGTEDSLIGRGGASFSDAVRSVTMLRELSSTEAANIGIDLSKLEEGSALLKWIHTKNNYGKKEVPFYIIRKPGPIFPEFLRVAPRGELIVNGDRLLSFLRAEIASGNDNWSYSAIKNKSTEHKVPQNKVKLALEHLVGEKKIAKIVSTKGGSHEVYRPIQ